MMWTETLLVAPAVTAKPALPAQVVVPSDAVPVSVIV